MQLKNNRSTPPIQIQNTLSTETVVQYSLSATLYFRKNLSEFLDETYPQKLEEWGYHMVKIS